MQPDVVAHACTPSTLGGRGKRISEFEASLVYRVSFRNSVSKKTNKQKKIIVRGLVIQRVWDRDSLTTLWAFL